MSQKPRGSKFDMYRVLFVCTGNTCRSPMAEAFFNILARENSLPMCAISAGINVTAEGATENAIEAAAEYGVDLTAHRPRSLTPDLIDKIDLILAMTTRHKSQIEERFPSAQDKSRVLLSFIGKRGDIDDPFSGSPEEYRACARRLWDVVNRVVARLALKGEGDHAR